MIDINLIRTDPERVRNAIIAKGEDFNLDDFIALDLQRRHLLTEVEKLYHKRNLLSKEVGEFKKENKNVDDKILLLTEIKNKISRIEEDLKKITQAQDEMSYWIPNIPHPSVPVGKDANDNIQIRQWGEIKEFDFEPKDHTILGKILGIIDLPRGSKISGSGFPLYKNIGAKLIRALASFMIDLHTKKHNYIEIFPPLLVNPSVVFLTGQLPKLKDEMYYLERDSFYLIPTAEPPVTAIFSDEILDAKDLPIKYVAWTQCFRREAGAYGKETHGIIRVHQFDKVELVKFTRPENSYEELESLVNDAEDVLKLLNIPYRVMLLCTGDLSFASAKCYDLEVWAPGEKKWLEVSSCSNFEDFQARRGKIRFKDGKKDKPKFVHTLNGSGVAFPRLIISLLENYQNKYGEVIIPEILRPYLDGLEKISPVT